MKALWPLLLLLLIKPGFATGQIPAGNSPADTCRKDGFQKKIGGNGEDKVYDLKVTDDNGFLLAGSTTSTSNGSPSNEDALLIKLNSGGNIVWQKKIGGSNADRFSQVLINSSGEYVAFGTTFSGINSRGSMLMMKFDTNGNATYSREYNFVNASHYGFIHLSKAIELPNGDIAFCGNATGINTDVGEPLNATFNIIGVLSANGAPKWVRRIREYYTESGGELLNMAHLNGALFISSSYGIMKFSAADGSTMALNKKFFYLGGFFAIEPFGMQVIAYSANYQVIFDQNLNVISAYRIQSIAPFYVLLNGFSSGSGTTMQGAHVNNQNAREYFPSISSFIGVASANWSYVYPHSQPEYRNLTGNGRTNDNSVIAFGEVRRWIDEDSYQPFDILLLKTDSAGRITDCPRANVNLSFSPANTQWIELHARYYPISTQQLTPALQVQDAALAEQPMCSNQNCDILQLVSTDTLCHLSDTLAIKANRSNDCDAFTEWMIDPTTTRIISANDSVIHLQFIKEGRFVIHAQITSECKLMADSVVVNVYNSPRALNLGPDIQLCKLNTYSLKAQKGFKSYLWQDGSTDSTLTVLNPGIYHVTATDFCDNVFRDTVIVTQAPDIPFDLGADLTLCMNDTATISAPAGFTKYYWSPNYNLTDAYTRTIRVSPEKDTTYTVIAEKSRGCLVSDSLRITVNYPGPIQVRNDTSICEGDELVITAPDGFNSYLWNTGEITESIRVLTRGTYTIVVTNSFGCKSKDTFELLSIYQLPLVDLGTDFAICRDKLHQFDAGDYNSYLWQDGTREQKLTTKSTGVYWVKVIDENGCKNSDTVSIISYADNPSGFLDSIAEICAGASSDLKAAPGYNRYRWYNNASSNSIRVTSAGEYWLEVTNANGCTARDTILVKSKDCLKGLFFPNAFTPGNSRNNNLFRPIVYGQVQSFRLIIFNRWGQKIFETTDPYQGWNGKINGQLAATNTYTWTATYKFSDSNETQQLRGTVTLIR